MRASRSEPLVIAHRGGALLGPENTLAAARAARAAGADVWEVDVRRTADGVLVLLHDESLLRTTDAAEIYPDRSPWLVHDFTYEELSRLNFAAAFPGAPNVASERARAHVAPEQVVTLAEALSFTRESNWSIDVELKDLGHDPAEAVFVEAAVSLIAAAGLLNQVLLSSFQHDYLRRARSLSADLRLGALVPSPVPQPEELLDRLDAQVYLPPAQGFDPAWIAPLRRAQRDVYVWTVNHERAMRRWIRAGVTGIITDSPHRLKALLKPMRSNPSPSEGAGHIP